MILDIRTGQDLEDWFFHRHSSGTFENVEYIDFESAYQEAKQLQGEDWDPQNPKSIGAQRLLFGIREGIREIVPCDKTPDIRMYRLVGSRFDKFHGADGSIEYQGERIFFDVTLSRSKAQRNLPQFKRDSVILVTMHQIKKGELGRLGYYMALELLKKRIYRCQCKELSGLVLQDDSGIQTFS